MARKIRKQSKNRMEISLGTVIDGFVKGIGLWPTKSPSADEVGGLLGLAAKLEKEGKDEYTEQVEIKGKTKNGKEYRGAYGFRVKVGLNPEDFKGRGKLPSGTGNK